MFNHNIWRPAAEGAVPVVLKITPQRPPAKEIETPYDLDDIIGHWKEKPPSFTWWSIKRWLSQFIVRYSPAKTRTGKHHPN